MLGLSALRYRRSMSDGRNSSVLVNPMSTANVLATLSKLIDVPVDLTRLNGATEMEKAIEELVEGNRIQKDEDLAYIG